MTTQSRDLKGQVDGLDYIEIKHKFFSKGRAHEKIPVIYITKS